MFLLFNRKVQLRLPGRGAHEQNVSLDDGIFVKLVNEEAGSRLRSALDLVFDEALFIALCFYGL